MKNISEELQLISEVFKSVLYEHDERFLEGMKDNNLARLLKNPYILINIFFVS